MKRFPWCVAVVLAFAVRGFADPPTLETLKGTWWDDAGTLTLEFGDGGSGSVTEGPLQAKQTGQFALTTGKLSFSSDRKPPTEWLAKVDGEEMTLSPGNSPQVVLKRETRDDREARLGETVVELLEARKALAAAIAEGASQEKARKQVDSIEPTVQGLRLSLAGPDPDKQKELIRKLLGKKGPAALAAFDAADVKEKDDLCASHLKQILTCAVIWDRANKAWPVKAALLKAKGYIESPDVFHCPASGKDDAYVLAASVPAGRPDDAVVVWDREPHPDGLRQVVLLGGGIVKMTEAELELAIEEGAAKVIPRFTIATAARKGEALAVEGTLGGLRVEEKDGKKRVRASVWLECSFQEKGRRVSAAKQVDVEAGAQPVTLSLALDFGGNPFPVGASFYVIVRDEVRGDQVFQVIEIK